MVAVVLVVATAALVEAPRLFRDPNLIDIRSPSIDACDPDNDPTCPTPNPSQDHPGVEPPGDNPVFIYGPGPSDGGPSQPVASPSAAS